MSLYLINIPVADLRREPLDLIPKDYSHHPLRESQLLLGEKLICHKNQTPWLYVEAIEQERYSPEKGWHGYPGWVHISEVIPVDAWPSHTHVVSKTHSIAGNIFSYGTLLTSNANGEILLPDGKKIPTTDHIRAIPKKFNPLQIISEAHLFLDAPYLWGGRASHFKDMISSVDCSGLIDLLYRAQGVQIPRDAHDQAMKMEEVSELEPGDPLYLAKENSERISHVILYCGDHTFIESPESGKHVRYLREGIDLWKKDQLYAFKERPHLYRAFPRRFKN